MALNLSKSLVMWFRVPGHRKAVYFPTVFVSSILLSVVSKQKYLGLMFDDTLSLSFQGMSFDVILFVSFKQTETDL